MSASLVALFHQTLREAGYSEGKTLLVEWRYLAGHIDRFPEVLGEVVGGGADVIGVWSPAGAVTAKKATTKIPIVFLAVARPVEIGLVPNLARPGGNVTGIAWSASPEDVAKELQLLREVSPTISRIAVIGSKDDPLAGETLRFTERAAGSMRIKVEWYTPASRGDLDHDLDAISRNRPHALVVAASGLAYVYRQVFIDFALQRRLPSVHQFRESVIDGALISFGPSLKEITVRGAAYIDKILKGAQPGDLPVEQPRTYEIAINLKTAKALGLTIPPSLLARADEVIQ